MAGESGRRGPCDGCEQGRDVPVGVTASSEYRGCLREVVAKKSLPLLLHPLRCVTMLARSHRTASRHTGSPAKIGEGAKSQLLRMREATGRSDGASIERSIPIR